MLEPLGRNRRHSTLFQFTTKQLRDFIDSNHPLIQIDEQLGFAKLVSPLEERYCSDFGRPAVHPEVMVRALLICSVYNIASFRRLCSAISENLAYGWFCFLTIDDPVFDHSTISHFIERVGRGGFASIFLGLNEELLRLGLLSREMYVDSTLVKANVSRYGLAPSGMTVYEFKECWCIPPKSSGEFVCAMEDVLEVYHRRYGDNEVLVCMDETSKQLVQETRQPRPARPGAPVAYDYEYLRNWVSNLFMLFAPLEGWRRVEVTEQRTKTDWARVVRKLVDVDYPD